jgi:DeoR family fructose operon transcriptional repressor
MLLDQRRNEILSLIEIEGFVAMQQLAERAGVSESTVRRDLEYLERVGQIRRTRGGAAYVGESITPLDERAGQAPSEKQAIAIAAAALVQPGEAILLDGGTTTLEVARHLIGKSLQVVTNSVPVVNLLANQPQIELVVIGGYLYPKTGVALGPLAMAALAEIHVRRLFMSVGGITEKGLYNSNALLADTERSMLSATEEVIVVADSSKFGHSALAHLCPLDRVHRVVVDSRLSEDWKRLLVSAGIALTIAEE